MSLRAPMLKAAHLIAGGVSALVSQIVTVLLVLVLIVIPDRPAAA
jgi:hypothetical protein